MKDSATNLNENGVALMESLSFIMVFATLTVFTIDFFTAIHTGIIHSMAARTYLFESLQHRADISLFRQAPKDDQGNPEFQSSKYSFKRFHAITDEFSNENIYPTGRLLTAVKESDQDIISGEKTSNLYIKVGYGICTDARCLASIQGGL